jgi:formate hydrogenlyase subunit 3/multisubunit Na+/H+ antiporter MnhD subunit
MNAPLVIFIMSLLFAIAALLIKHRAFASSMLAASGALLIALFVLLAPIDEPLSIFGLSIKVSGTWGLLGRRFVLDSSTRPYIGFLYLAGAFLLFASWIARTPDYFNAVALLELSVVGASLIVDPFLYAAIFLEIAAMGAVLLLVSREHSARLGALRLLTLFTLAMIVILVTGWILGVMGVTEATPDLARRASTLLGIGFAILLAVPPFHLWMPTAAREAHPYVLSFVSVLLLSAGLFFMLRFFETYPWLRENAAMFSAVRTAGVFAVLFGSLMSVSQVVMRKFMVYTLLVDLGVMLIAVGLGTNQGLQIALSLTAARVVGLAIWSLSIAKLSTGDQGPAGYIGIAYRSPLLATSLVVGILSLGGFPLMASFPGRWALMDHLVGTDNYIAFAVISSILLVLARGMRWLSIFGAGSPDVEPIRISSVEQAFFYLGILSCITLGILPQIFYPWIMNVIEGLTRLVQ